MAISHFPATVPISFSIYFLQKAPKGQIIFFFVESVKVCPLIMLRNVLEIGYSGIVNKSNMGYI